MSIERARWMFLCCKWALRVHVLTHGFYVGIDRPLLFSERYGYKRVFRIGRVALEVF